MNAKSRWILTAVVFALGLGLALAEEKLGVQVYPGAKFDADVSQVVSSAMNIEGYCYRTKDGVANKE
jgi:hypothetical protein